MKISGGGLKNNFGDSRKGWDDGSRVKIFSCLGNQCLGLSATADDVFDSLLRRQPDVTPVFCNLPHERTLDAALTLFPLTRHVVVLSGSAPRDQSDLPQLRELEVKTWRRLEWSYLTGLSADEFKSSVAHLPDQTIVV